MFRKPQNLQIQGQSTEVNPNISAGPTLPLGAPLGPRETFQPIDVSGLSQTLNKLGKVRQESIDQAAADVGTILGQMQAEGATVDQMLKKATGVAPKRLLTDLEKMIRAGTIEKVDSPAFQIAFQERRATFRVRAKYMEILSNEELLNQVAQSISMSGLAEGEVTLQGAINDLTAEAKQDFADLGPFSDRAVFAAVAEMEERLTNELVARSRKLTRETNDALVANNINTFIMETVGGYVGEEDKTIDDVERQDFYTSILKDFAEFRGTTGDPYGEYMRHLKKSGLEVARVHGPEYAKAMFEVILDMPHPSGKGGKFVPADERLEMEKEIRMLEGRILRDAEDRPQRQSRTASEAEYNLFNAPAIQEMEREALAKGGQRAMMEYQNDLLEMVADPSVAIIMANGEPLPEEQRPFLQSIVISRMSMLKRTAAGEDTAVTEDALARITTASLTMAEQNAEGKEGTQRFVEYVQNLMNALNASPTARARVNRILVKDTNATTQSLRADVIGNNMRPALRKAVLESLAYNGEISKDQESEASRLIQEQEEEWYGKIGDLVDDLGYDGAQKEWPRIRQEWLDELPKTFEPKTELLDVGTDLEVSELLPDASDRKAVARYKDILSFPGITAPNKGLGGVSAQEMAISWKEIVQDDDSWRFTKSGDHPVVRLQDAVKAVQETGVSSAMLKGPKTRRVARLYTLLQESDAALTESDMQSVRAHSLLSTGLLDSFDLMYMRQIERGSPATEANIRKIVEKLADEDIRPVSDLDTDPDTELDVNPFIQLRGEGGGVSYLQVSREDWAKELGKGVNFDGFSVYQVRLSDFADSKKYIKVAADGDTVIWNKDTAKGSEYQLKRRKVAVMLEAEGLVASEDAILKFFAVQRNIWSNK